MVDPLQALVQTLTSRIMLVPALLDAAQAGPYCGHSEASWWRMDEAGRIPEPIRFGDGGTAAYTFEETGETKVRRKGGSKVLWDRRELEEWIAHRCPDRATWKAMKGERK